MDIPILNGITRKSILTDTCVAVYEFERGRLLKNTVRHFRFTCAMTSPLKKQNNVATHNPCKLDMNEDKQINWVKWRFKLREICRRFQAEHKRKTNARQNKGFGVTFIKLSLLKITFIYAFHCWHISQCSPCRFHSNLFCYNSVSTTQLRFAFDKRKTYSVPSLKYSAKTIYERGARNKKKSLSAKILNSESVKLLPYIALSCYVARHQSRIHHASCEAKWNKVEKTVNCVMKYDSVKD